MVLPGMISPPGFFAAPEEGSGLITANLKVQFEMDNPTAPTATSWVDNVAGINLIVQPSMVAPSIISGGTPTGQDYYQFTENEGLGTILLSGEDLPDGAETRSLYVLCRYPSASSPFFNGVVYGINGDDEAFGIIVNLGESTLTIEFYVSAYTTTAELLDDTFHVLLITLDGLGNVGAFKDNVSFTTSGTATTDTDLVKFYINELLEEEAGRAIDVAAILLYAGVHDAFDREQTYLYLKNKYIGA